MKALVLAGPTASGKSSCALHLAQVSFPGLFEIISADSVQIYRGLDIGSGKVTPAERGIVPHHLIDIIPPSGRYSAGQYRIDALAVCSAVVARGRIPCFVGGTGLYLDAVFEGLSEAPETDPSLAAGLRVRGEREGWAVLHTELSTVDPDSAARIHDHDSQRIIRALAVYLQSGRTLASYRGNRHGVLSADTCYVVLEPDRGELYTSIDARVDVMMRHGFLEEVRGLLAEGSTRKDPGLCSIGYAELAAHLAGELSLDDAVSRIKHVTRKYAKKQMIWFRRKTYAERLSVPDGTALSRLVEQWLKKI